MDESGGGMPQLPLPGWWFLILPVVGPIVSRLVLFIVGKMTEKVSPEIKVIVNMVVTAILAALGITYTGGQPVDPASLVAMSTMLGGSMGLAGSKLRDFYVGKVAAAPKGWKNHVFKGYLKTMGVK